MNDTVNDENKASDGVRAVDRALAVLMAFAGEPGDLTASELARRAGVSRPTLYRLIYTLEKQGFILSHGEPLRFRLGPAIAALAQTWFSTLDLKTLAEPILRRLSESTGETVSLVLLQGDNRVCVSEIPSAHSLSFRVGVGNVKDVIERGAPGRAILPFLSDAVLARALAAEGTPAARAELERELADIRRNGYCVSRNVVNRGAAGVAAPVFGHEGKVVGSLAVLGPEVRFADEEVSAHVRRVMDAARQLTARLGGKTDGGARL